MAMDFWRKRVAARLARMGGGRLAIYDEALCVRGAEEGEEARVVVRDGRAWRAFARGSAAAAEAYARGWWDAPDLFAVMRLAARNIEAINAEWDGGWRRSLRVLREMAAAVRRRMLPRASAGRDVAAHYDLGNEFFALFLDESLAYSCAVFEDPARGGAAALAAAQTRKLDKICDKLALRARDRVLDLGCGWGSFSFHAARRAECEVTALTLSAAQHSYVAGAEEGGVRAVLRDYRAFAPARAFEKVSSVEMIEAVGEKQFGVYFRRIREFLTDDGLAQVQAILIPDARYRAARRDADFIRRQIFPGGALPSLEVIRAAAARARLRVAHVEDIGAHYAPTLLAWRERFNARRARVRALGFDERFCRAWEYYFCYCAGGFAAGALSCAQLVLAPARR